jgi:hypothetical protein
MKILNILSDKIEIENEFIADMCELLQIYSYPFFKERASDEMNYEQVVTECMANLGLTFIIIVPAVLYLFFILKGYLLRTASREVRMVICTTILNLITFKSIPDSYANLQRVSKAFILKTIRNSDLAETLVKVI